jgi:purine-cytosine permease-like protein
MHQSLLVVPLLNLARQPHFLQCNVIGWHNTKIMLVILNIFLCLLNLAMAFTNYEKRNYKSAMCSMFAAGFIIAVAIAISIPLSACL